MTKKQPYKQDKDLRIPTTPHRLAQAVVRGGAKRRKSAKK